MGEVAREHLAGNSRHPNLHHEAALVRTMTLGGSDSLYIQEILGAFG